MKEKIMNVVIRLKNVFIALFLIGALALAGRSDYEDVTGTPYNDGWLYALLIIFGIFTAYISTLSDKKK